MRYQPVDTHRQYWLVTDIRQTEYCRANRSHLTAAKLLNMKYLTGCRCFTSPSAQGCDTTWRVLARALHTFTVKARRVMQNKMQIHNLKKARYMMQNSLTQCYLMGICDSEMPANSAETYKSDPDFLSALCDLTKSSESSLISLPLRQQFVAFLLLEGKTKHQFMQNCTSIAPMVSRIKE